jgi:MoxR-like ATPase
VVNEHSYVQLLRDAANGKKIMFIFDEINRGHDSLQNLLISFFDSHADNFIIRNNYSSEVFQIPEENIIWYATMNE